MCLAIPGKLVGKEERGGTLMGRVDFGGVVREVQLDFVPEVEVGEYVIVHVGFALSRLDAAEAARTIEILKEMGALENESGILESDSEVRSPEKGVRGPGSEVS